MTPETLRLITEAAVNPLGRSLDVSLEEYARLAARRRERLVAEVHVAVALTDRAARPAGGGARRRLRAPGAPERGA